MQVANNNISSDSVAKQIEKDINEELGSKSQLNPDSVLSPSSSKPNVVYITKDKSVDALKICFSINKVLEY